MEYDHLTHLCAVRMCMPKNVAIIVSNINININIVSQSSNLNHMVMKKFAKY